MAFFDDNRDTLAAELFSKKPLAPRTTDPTPSTQGLRQKFIKLERLRKQELARWWDITTLKRYLEIKQVPRGLRVIIFPSFEDLDPDLLGEWEHLISSTSFSMINILIKHSDRKRTKLLLDITSLEEEIKNLNLPEATDKNYTIMREILTGYQLYIKDKKMRKLVRDDNDYKNGGSTLLHESSIRSTRSLTLDRQISIRLLRQSRAAYQISPTFRVIAQTHLGKGLLPI
ncbi:hypothetical protein NDU88_006219 [Pleurodeles waltl]|uniref:Uncharacterized protein n=1 Tax=Pleurodeles waltl TaxID=8319 RepID=A0AAV7TWK5_PLEWA|nr:hypothetical protein NDU88_006219 [Pleurodeles waltl]